MPPRRMRPEEMVTMILAFMEREGRDPTRHDFESQRNGLPSRKVVDRAFRQWQHAVEAAHMAKISP